MLPNGSLIAQTQLPHYRRPVALVFAAVVACDLPGMNVVAYPYYRNAHAHLVRGGQVTFNGHYDIETRSEPYKL